MHFQKCFGDEAPDGELTFDHDGQRGRLHPADRQFFAIRECVRARKVHADQPVRPATPPGGIGERVVVRGGPQGVKSFAYRLGCE